jgi:hypothetical protein
VVKVILAALVIFSAETVNANAIKTTDQMTCSAVIRQVKTEGRYFEASVDGALPIYPITPIPAPEQSYGCTGKSLVWQEIVKTRDSAACLVGYTCRSF